MSAAGNTLLTAALDRAHQGDAAAWDQLVALRAQVRAAGDPALARRAGAGALVCAHHQWRFEGFEDCWPTWTARATVRSRATRPASCWC